LKPDVLYAGQLLIGHSRLFTIAPDYPSAKSGLGALSVEVLQKFNAKGALARARGARQ